MNATVTPELLEVALLRDDAVIAEDSDTGELVALPRLTSAHASDPRWIVLINHARAADYYAAARSRGRVSRLEMAARAASIDLAAENAALAALA